MWSLRSLWTVLAVALVPAVGPAAPPEADFSDVLQTLRANKRLQQDDVLAPLNIGIKVRGRIAVLWGPVPTAELASRAERSLRGMIELIEVRNEMIVIPEDLRDVPIPEAPAPLFLPEKAPPPLPDAPRRFLRRDLAEPAPVELASVSSTRPSSRGPTTGE